MEYSYKFVLIVDLGVSLVNLELMVDDMTTKELREKPVLSQPLSLSLSCITLLFLLIIQLIQQLLGQNLRKRHIRKGNEKEHLQQMLMSPPFGVSHPSLTPR